MPDISSFNYELKVLRPASEQCEHEKISECTSDRDPLPDGSPSLSPSRVCMLLNDNCDLEPPTHSHCPAPRTVGEVCIVTFSDATAVGLLNKSAGLLRASGRAGLTVHEHKRAGTAHGARGDAHSGSKRHGLRASAASLPVPARGQQEVAVVDGLSAHVRAARRAPRVCRSRERGATCSARLCSTRAL